MILESHINGHFVDIFGKHILIFQKGVKINEGYELKRNKKEYDERKRKWKKGQIDEKRVQRERRTKQQKYENEYIENEIKENQE